MKMQFNTYYSEELRKDMLELSDRRLLWEVPNGVMEYVWNDACDTHWAGVVGTYVWKTPRKTKETTATWLSV
jgi:hypothetical protein